MSRYRAAHSSFDYHNCQPTHCRSIIIASQWVAVSRSPGAPNKLFPFIVRVVPSSPLPTPPPNDRPRPTLPIELYRLIATNVTSTYDLCTLSRVSKAWQKESERILYHTLTLRRALDLIWRSQCLLSRPSLSAHIRKLSITLSQYTPLGLVSRILAACTRLRVLYIQGIVWADYSCVLDSVATNTQLRAFGCHTRGEAGVVRFLARQPDLERLDLSVHAFDLDDLPPHALPRLRVFTGWLTTAAALARGGRRRPLRRLTLVDDSPEREMCELLGQLHRAGASLVALDLRVGVLRNPIAWAALESVVFSLGNLRFFGICSLECTRVRALLLSPIEPPAPRHTLAILSQFGRLFLQVGD
jgi:hypothetical protein